MELRYVPAHLVGLQLFQWNVTRQFEQGGDVAPVVLDGVPA